MTALDRLRSNQRGVALIEFAIGLPVFLTLVVCGLETVNLIMAHQQVSRIATSTADLAARYRAAIDEGDVKQLFLGAKLSAENIDFQQHGRLILSSVMRNTGNNGHWVRWQRCEGQLGAVISVIGPEDAGKTGTGSATSIPTVKYSAATPGMTLNPGDNTMTAEATFEYQPLFVSGIHGLRIRYAASFMARELALPSLTNSNNIPNNQKALCA